MIDDTEQNHDGEELTEGEMNEQSARVAEVVGDQIDLTKLPGFHVTRQDNGMHLGTYGTREDAEAYISGQLEPQNVGAEIVEGRNA